MRPRQSVTLTARSSHEPSTHLASRRSPAERMAWRRFVQASGSSRLHRWLTRTPAAPSGTEKSDPSSSRLTTWRSTSFASPASVR